jgi:putative flippase GtrA
MQPTLTRIRASDPRAPARTVAGTAAVELGWGSGALGLARLLTPMRLALLRQFLRFGTVGFGGFLIDNACVYGLRHAVGLYWSGLFAWVLAASGTWLLNRIWTFRGRGSGPMYRQWLSFMAANGFGFTLNRGMYFTLITISPLCVQYPVLAIIAGTATGMFLNFHLFRTVVFR